jgi:hypothetical protein
MFSLIYSSLIAYAIHKGKEVDGLGPLVIMLIISDLIALNIIFN